MITKKSILTGIYILSVLVILSGPAHALKFFGPPPEEQPSIFAYSLRGFGSGIFGGLSVGYLSYGLDNHENAKNVAMNVGYGGTLCMAGGTIICVVDMNSDHQGRGNVVLRDISTGGYLGTMVGAFWGMVIAFTEDDSKYIPSG